MSEKMDYREAVKELVYKHYDPDANEQEVYHAILALLDKVRQAQAAECAKHVPLVGSLGEVIGCHECDWRSVGENGVDEWREHLTALGRK